MANLTLKINNSTVDSVGGGTWISVDPNNDYFIFSQGSGAGLGVSDGDAIPAESLLNRYAVVLDDTNPVVVPKYFLADYSTNLLKEIKLAGNQNKQYVFAADFDGATATEPQLEAWDTLAMTSAIIVALGNGTPNSSWYRAVATLSALPGADWVGIPLGGNNTSNVLLLNEGNGPLTGASTLYFNFKITIPGGYVTPGVHTPILAVVFTTN
jgi:hypothetical protein